VEQQPTYSLDLREHHRTVEGIVPVVVTLVGSAPLSMPSRPSGCAPAPSNNRASKAVRNIDSYVYQTDPSWGLD
jgi:hypothetical protein